MPQSDTLNTVYQEAIESGIVSGFFQQLAGFVKVQPSLADSAIRLAGTALADTKVNDVDRLHAVDSLSAVLPLTESPIRSARATLGVLATAMAPTQAWYVQAAAAQLVNTLGRHYPETARQMGVAVRAGEVIQQHGSVGTERPVPPQASRFPVAA